MKNPTGLQKLTSKVLKNAKLPKNDSKDYFNDLRKLNRTKTKEVLQFQSMFQKRVSKRDREKLLGNKMSDLQIEKFFLKYFAGNLFQGQKEGKHAIIEIRKPDRGTVVSETESFECCME